jgi:hypothetical protein
MMYCGSEDSNAPHTYDRLFSRREMDGCDSNGLSASIEHSVAVQP